jgi:hypothetical protein
MRLNLVSVLRSLLPLGEGSDASTHHEPPIEEGEDCVSLAAMLWDLRWQRFLGRLIQPFIPH